MTNTTPPPPTTPAGWYDDGQGHMRWWNGVQWTDSYAPVVVQRREPMDPFSVLGFVLGLVALALFSAGPITFGLGVLGLIASIYGARDAVRRGRGLAVAGLVLCGVAVLVGLLGSVRVFTGA